jgi:hypothetical protein
MSDERLREAERRWKESGSVEEEARYLLERVRVGDLTRDRLEFAAYLGHVGAVQALAPRDVEPLWNGRSVSLHTLFASDPSLPLRVGHAIANAVVARSEDQDRLELPSVDRLLASEGRQMPTIPRNPSPAERAINLVLLAAAQPALRRWNIGVLINELARTAPDAFATGLRQVTSWALQPRTTAQ